MSTAPKPKQDDRAGAEEAPARGRGRPRSEEADQAILDATLRMVGEHGVAGTTIEGVAAEAGVGKTTIYRRWPNKNDLILAAISNIVPPGDPPDTGTMAGDMAALAETQRRRLSGSGLSGIVPRVLAESMSDPSCTRTTSRGWSSRSAPCSGCSSSGASIAASCVPISRWSRSWTSSTAYRSTGC